MSGPTQAATSLLTEHLRYTPISLIDDIINSVNCLIYHAVSSVENGLSSTSPANLGFGSSDPNNIPDTDGDGNVVYPEARQEVEDGVHQLETLFESAVDKDFDKLEIIALRSILSIPEDLVPWVRLQHYENLTFPTAPDAPTPESINLQRRKLRETQKLYTLLLQEQSRNAALIVQLRGLLAPPPDAPKNNSTSLSAPKLPNNLNSDAEASQGTSTKTPTLAFLTAHPAARALGVGETQGQAQSPLTTNSTFLLSQLPALRSLVNSLRPYLSSLITSSSSGTDPAVRGAAGTQGAAARAHHERTLYIERQTRRHLERTQGLRLGEQGGVVGGGGEWTGGGRRVGPDEVAALERVVGGLAGAGRAAAAAADEDEEMDEGE
ncbi:MAG: hypothetical protein M1819_005929 [Sarea resinae]|nr:MAG: hypothetical protein M1819_005929 [Sarea resinae]